MRKFARLFMYHFEFWTRFSEEAEHRLLAAESMPLNNVNEPLRKVVAIIEQITEFYQKCLDSPPQDRMKIE